MDIDLAKSLHIPIVPAHGTIQLASASHSLPRFGTTPPLPCTLVLVEDSIRTLSERTHAFELMELPHDQQYQFIVGMDLLREIFPDHIPTSLMSSDDQSHAAAASVVRGPTSSLIHTPIPRTPLSASIAAELQRDIATLEGQGYIPAEEQPVRVSTQTPADFEHAYSVERNNILQLPSIAAALKANEAITSLCTLPSAELRLTLDPLKATPKLLYARQYPLSQRAIEAARPVVARWLETGKIVRAPVGCPWNNPLLVVPKKDDTGQLTGFRVCLDVRKLNTALVDNDHFEIPLIRNVLDSLQGCTIFGEFDLAEAYLQFPLHSESQQYTAFTWGTEQYMFVVCPFGLHPMPSFFQRNMWYVFSDLPFVFAYFDNIPYGSKSWKEHAAHTLAIIERLNHYSLRIKPSSVKVGQAQLNCLGHLLTESGVAISPDKLIKINDWPLPRTGKQLASFLGLITFVRQHVRHFADITSGLEAVKRTKGDIAWTPALTKSFELIRHAIAHAPLLRFPDFNKPFYVATDASCLGIGGVLYQPTEDDKEDITGDNIIAICSKKLNDCQRRYSTYKKELFSIMYCLRQFHAYIWGHHKVVIITDHMPLTYIKHSASLAHSLQQWLDVILDYDFDIKHRPGVLHVLPDALSRMYEALYESAWGVPRSKISTDSIIEKHKIPIDTDILTAMSQPAPSVDQRSRPRARSATVSSVPASRGGKVDMQIQAPIDFDADDVQITQDQHGLPSTRHLHVTDSSIREGLGLFARSPFTIGSIILDTSTDPIFSGYLRTTRAADGNARRFVDPDTGTAHVVATRPIAQDHQILITRTLLVRNVTARNVDVEAKYDELEEGEVPSVSSVAPSAPISNAPSRVPSSSIDNETKLLVELERRGKTSPETEALRLSLIDAEHERGHFGRDSIYRAIYRAGHWWPGMRGTIQERIRECIPCLRFNIAKRGFDPATPITAALPYDHIQIDNSVGLPKSQDGMTALLAIVDVCTGFVIFRPLPNTKAETIAIVLWQVFNDFGFPKVIQSDNGPEFVNRIISKMLTLSGINHRRITPYHARADGKVERNIGTVMTIIRKHLHGANNNWPAFVPWAQSCINNKIAELTGSTPFSLMFGRKFNVYQDYSSSAPLEVMNEQDWATQQDRMLSIVYPSIAERVSVQKGKMVARLNKRTPSHLKKGDIVMLRRNEAESGSPVGKFEAQYTGPYQIASVSRSGAITLITSTGAPFPRLVRPHQLKFVSHSSKDFQQETYEIDRILGHKGEGDDRTYLIRWKGYGPEGDTWEPVSNIHTDEVIQDYLTAVQLITDDVSSDDEKDRSPPAPGPTSSRVAKPRSTRRRS
jgi:hypothetical protein